MHAIVAKQARMHYLICIWMIPKDVQRLMESVYISGNAQVTVLQIICYTSGILKSVKTYVGNLWF